jgi:KDO2-lipid IV(A) lauroyltransferase
MSAPPLRTAYVHKRGRWAVRAGEWSLFALARAFRAVTWPVPVWTLTDVLAPLGGWVALAVPGFRRRAERNLAHVWPGMEPGARRRLVRGAGREVLRLMVEYAHLDRLLRTAEIAVEGAEHLEAARARGGGIVLVTAHYGNWEAARQATRGLGVESGIFYRAFNNRYLDRFGVELIGRVGRPVLHKGRQGMRALLGAVAGGGSVMILVDQRITGAPLLPFLGRPAETATAPAEIARRSGAALLPVMARREAGRRRFRVRFEAPVTGGSAEAMMVEVNARIGAWVEEAPEQWFWFHRRWRGGGAVEPGAPQGS